MNNTPIDKSYENDVGKFIEFKGKFAGSKGRKRSGMIQLVFKEVVSVVDNRPFRDHVCIFVSKEKAKKAGLHAGMTEATWEFYRFRGKLTYYNGGKVEDNSFVPVSIGLKDIEYIKRMETVENEKPRDRVRKGNER